jgi:hypothetical protein
MADAVEAHEASQAAQAAMKKRHLLLAIKEYMRAATKFGDATRCTEDAFTVVPTGRPLVLSCLIHAASWAYAPRWGEGRSSPTTPIYAPKSLGVPASSDVPG